MIQELKTFVFKCDNAKCSMESIIQGVGIPKLPAGWRWVTLRDNPNSSGYLDSYQGLFCQKCYESPIDCYTIMKERT